MIRNRSRITKITVANFSPSESSRRRPCSSISHCENSASWLRSLSVTMIDEYAVAGLLAHELVVPALDVLDRHRHADRHRALLTRRRRTASTRRGLCFVIVAGAGDRREAEADREPHRRQAARWMSEVDEVRCRPSACRATSRTGCCRARPSSATSRPARGGGTADRRRRSSSDRAAGTGCSTGGLTFVSAGGRRRCTAGARRTALPALIADRLPASRVPLPLPSTAAAADGSRAAVETRRRPLPIGPAAAAAVIGLSGGAARRLDDVVPRILRRRRARDAVRVRRVAIPVLNSSLDALVVAARSRGSTPSAKPPTSNLRSLPSKSPRPTAGNASAIRGTRDSRPRVGARIVLTVAVVELLADVLAEQRRRAARRPGPRSSGKIFSSDVAGRCGRARGTARTRRCRSRCRTPTG